MIRTGKQSQLHTFFLFIIYAGLWTTSLTGQRAEDYQTLAADGSWCWFSDPRAVYHKGIHERTYMGFVTSTGNVMLTSEDHQTGEKVTQLLYKNLQADDHVNPSLLFLPDGRLMVYFTKHSGTIYYATSTNPETIEAFGPVDSLFFGDRLCYTNPVMLSAENNRIYLFFRGGKDWKPSFITSDDLGGTWSDPKSFVSKKINDPSNRPYMKIFSDGDRSIHFAFTDGHPREENLNSIYYLHYQGGQYYDAAGNKIGDMQNLPIVQESIPKAYDGVLNNQRAWIWDIALDQENKPVIAYTTLPEETQHFYNYGRWNGHTWENHRICPGGSAFPRFERKKEMRDPEPHYSGGISIDHENPGTVYLSRPHNDRFEIEEWKTTDGGKTFFELSITSNSLKDNVRPFVIRRAPDNFVPRVLWMYIDHYAHYSDYHTSIKGNKPANRFSPEITKEAVRNVMLAVADWQIDNFASVKHHPLDWTNGALYKGMMEWAKIASDGKYLNWLLDIGKRYAWQPYNRMYHADDIVVSQMYLEMYKLHKADPYRYRILAPTQARLDYVMAHPSKGTLYIDYRDPQSQERWSWCDALFMAPPVYVQLAALTGNKDYLSFMDREFKATYNFLYDPDEHLFYRDYRYFPEKQREANGEKIFWGRGNGWVMGGLASILNDLPGDSVYRPFYTRLFREMAEKIAACQGNEGFWHASMLDHESFPKPETSSSAFFCYALAWGMNSGLLDRTTYEPVVRRAWSSLVSAVFPDGKLGWVQPIGENPKNVTADMTEVYGVGAFLLAGTEILKLAK